MSLTLLIVWIALLALALASYAWMALSLVRTDVRPAARWSVLLPPLAAYFAFRRGGLLRALALLWASATVGYIVARQLGP